MSCVGDGRRAVDAKTAKLNIKRTHNTNSVQLNCSLCYINNWLCGTKRIREWGCNFNDRERGQIKVIKCIKRVTYFAALGNRGGGSPDNVVVGV